MAKTRFPKTIHVIEETYPNDDPALVVTTAGIDDLDTEQDVAVYQLVKVGRVKIDKKLVDK